MPKALDLVGQKFGRLNVIERTERRPRSWWMCLCDCGKTTEIQGDRMISGHTKSCGCLAFESRKSCSFKHGHSRVNGTQNPSREYHSWRAMKLRCYNPDTAKYEYYGGRGITVCERWMEDDGFNNFLNDMGPKPIGHSIERKNNNGNYEPSNCRWATRRDQARNTSQVKMIEFNGKTQCIKDWASELGFRVECLYSRLKYGWSVENALTLRPNRHRAK